MQNPWCHEFMPLRTDSTEAAAPRMHAHACSCTQIHAWPSGTEARPTCLANECIWKTFNYTCEQLINDSLSCDSFTHCVSRSELTDLLARDFIALSICSNHTLIQHPKFRRFTTWTGDRYAHTVQSLLGSTTTGHFNLRLNTGRLEIYAIE